MGLSIDPFVTILYKSDMPIQHIALLTFVLLALCATGCVMRRTVKEGNEVVAQGYVVKSPLIAP